MIAAVNPVFRDNIPDLQLGINRMVITDGQLFVLLGRNKCVDKLLADTQFIAARVGVGALRSWKMATVPGLNTDRWFAMAMAFY